MELAGELPSDSYAMNLPSSLCLTVWKFWTFTNKNCCNIVSASRLIHMSAVLSFQNVSKEQGPANTGRV